MSRRGRFVVLMIVALATIGCDRVTKHAASTLLAGAPHRSYFADTVRLAYQENTGGFLSLGADLPPAARTAIFTIMTGLALLALIAIAIRERLGDPSVLGLVLFVAGGSSNWVDRVVRGSVVDFLNVGIGPVRTGVFNIADMAIMAGAALLVVGALRPGRAAAPTADPASGRTGSS